MHSLLALLALAAKSKDVENVLTILEQMLLSFLFMSSLSFCERGWEFDGLFLGTVESSESSTSWLGRAGIIFGEVVSLNSLSIILGAGSGDELCLFFTAASFLFWASFKSTFSLGVLSDVHIPHFVQMSHIVALK